MKVKDKKKKLNPFEVHINREKFRVLGKKSKNDKGLPGVSRAKALSIRKHTLLPAFKLKDKSGNVKDKRIGEFDKNLSTEDKYIARYAKIRSNKKSIFNLADEPLTHRGQLLSELEKFDDPRSDEDDDDDDGRSGGLDKDFVRKAHFGGGMLREVGSDGAKTHKELIDQLIADSKKRKAEKQQQNEETFQMTAELNKQWKDLIPLVCKSKKDVEDDGAKKKEEYDLNYGKLKLAIRGNVTDRLKSEEEIAKEEKERLEKLEQERLDRMRGVSSNEIKKKHVSADDLDDNFNYGDDEEVTLSYNIDGVANVEVNAEINGKLVKKGHQEESDDEENNESEEEMGEEEAEEEQNESDDNLSDLKESDSESEDEEMEKDSVGIETNEEYVEKMEVKHQDKTKIIDDLLRRKDIMEKARKELSYTFKLPENDKELVDLLKKESPERQGVILERMIKCNHPSLAASNKENLGKLFLYLMQYLNVISSEMDNQDVNKLLKIFYNVLPHIFDLAHFNPANTHEVMKGIIEEKHSEYKKTPKNYPGIDVLIYFKLVSCLFSTSDFKHKVVIPTFAFIDQMLNNCKVRNRRDIAYGLFLITTLNECTKLSKRFLPSSVNFLAGVLYLAVPKTGVKLLKIPPPFKKSSNDLVLTSNNGDYKSDLRLNVNNLINGSFSDEFRLQSIHLTLQLLVESFENAQEFPSSCELFGNINKYMEMIQWDNYPDETRTLYNKFKESSSNSIKYRNISYIVVAAPRPKALRLYEPSIQTIYDMKKRKSRSKESAETEKLIHKVKKEKKAALRKIRGDKSFMARLKINDKIRSDTERKRKVNRIFADIASDAHEAKKLKKSS